MKQEIRIHKNIQIHQKLTFIFTKVTIFGEKKTITREKILASQKLDKGLLYKMHKMS